ncbi:MULTISPECIES: hypothetical protein [unclassified Paenibacillus]|uniref:hypothetical protein n=1 Tax=unclassified Paenibacillus TaxID=185978 RepID=UPI00363636EA
MSFKTSRINLMERLALHLKSEVALQAVGFASEPGVLQKVGKRFIRVSGQFFVPHTLQEIVLLGVPRRTRGTKVSLRTTYMGSFSAVLVKAGVDFAEVIVTRQDEEEELVILIPYNHLISIEQI